MGRESALLLSGFFMFFLRADLISFYYHNTAKKGRRLFVVACGTFHGCLLFSVPF